MPVMPTEMHETDSAMFLELQLPMYDLAFLYAGQQVVTVISDE